MSLFVQLDVNWPENGKVARVGIDGAGLPLGECLRMASLYPAALAGRGDQLGRIAPGYRADLVHFDASFAVHNTWLAGQREQYRGR